MPRMLNADRIRFPHFSHFVLNVIPTSVPQRPKVWDAFKFRGQMGSFMAYLALSSRDGSPLLRLRAMPASNGEFDSAQPDRIFIATEIAKRFEAEHQNEHAQQTVESTVLHELVHWGDLKADGKHTTAVEAGRAFEFDAYGGDIDRWWLQRDQSSRPADLISANIEITATMPRGIRNHNPGNIKVNSDWIGLATRDEMTEFQREENVFCVFTEPVWGIRAMALLLRNHHKIRSARSVYDYINIWAPRNENDTKAYATQVAKALKVRLREAINIDDRDLLATMVGAMIFHENGIQPYDDELIAEGIEKAFSIT